MENIEQRVVIENPGTPRLTPRQIARKYLLRIAGVCILFFLLYTVLFSVPVGFPKGQSVIIPPGESLQSITEMLYSKHIINSRILFRSAVIFFGGEKRVIAGEYLLNSDEGSVVLALRLVRGNFHLEPIKITIPEGWNVFAIAEYLSKHIVGFDTAHFIEIARGEEGYLFPDTYFISPNASAEVVVSIMQNNFNKKITSLDSEIKKSGHTKEEIIIMASIVEGEARTLQNRKIVSGVLWKRISLGMPLQVDAAFSYVNGKNSYTLTASDLKIDSPYNTYKYAGLPPGPISNPGLESIDAALHPVQTDYLYFLTGKDGVMYYAKTFEEHKKNKAKYL
ncbi:MAG: endolytic transglycosylase MltG [Patescibacteria group bacterium]